MTHFTNEGLKMMAERGEQYIRMDTLVERFRVKLYSDAENALTLMNNNQITPDQKFALAVLAGVEYYYDEEARLWRTKYPCDVCIAGPKVFVHAQDANGHWRMVEWTKPKNT